MKVTPSYEAFCSLCEQQGWRLELRATRTEESRLFYMRVMIMVPGSRLPERTAWTVSNGLILHQHLDSMVAKLEEMVRDWPRTS